MGVSALLAPTVAAQAAVKVTAHTELQVYLNGSARLPRGTDLTSGRSLSLTHPTPCAAGASATVEVVHGVAPKVTFSNGAYYGGDPIYCTSYVAAWAGEHSILLEFSSPTRLEGRLALFANQNHSGTCSIDVGNDGTTELRGAAGIERAAELPVVLTAIPLPVRLTGAANWSSSSGWGVGGSGAIVEFLPGTGKIAAYGLPCHAGLNAMYRQDREPLPSGKLIAHDFLLLVSRPPALRAAFFLIGVSPQSVPLPTLGCTLLTDILAYTRLPSLSLPVGLAALDVRVQYVADVGTQGFLDLRTSEGLRLVLP
jgi:hypothetical protein